MLEPILFRLSYTKRGSKMEQTTDFRPELFFLFLYLNKIFATNVQEFSEIEYNRMINNLKLNKRDVVTSTFSALRR